MVLHDEDAEELHNFNELMIAMRQQFEDPLADQRVKQRIRTIKQGRQSIIAYIKQFWGLASKLLGWFQEILLEYFQQGLNQEVLYIYLSQGHPEPYEGAMSWPMKWRLTSPFSRTTQQGNHSNLEPRRGGTHQRCARGIPP